MGRQGLSRDQVVIQRQKYGENRLPDRENKSIVRLILAIITEPMIFLLLAVVIVYFSWAIGMKQLFWRCR